MSTTPDAIDQLFSFTLNGIAYTVEIIGKNAPQIAKFFMGLTHQGVRTKGSGFSLSISARRTWPL